MIRIIVSGIHGRMGKEIISLAEGFNDVKIVAGYDKVRGDIFVPVVSDVEKLQNKFDVIIDFSSPEATMKVLTFAVKNSKPIVIGTTAFDNRQNKEIMKLSKKIPIFKASNMSMGINVVMEVLKNLPDIVYKDFDVEIVETHHSRKKDSPSATAKTIAQLIAERVGKKRFLYGRKGKELKRRKGDIGLHSLRGGTIIGTHTTYFLGNDESIEITHRANSRSIFAYGAMIAAKWIVREKPGLYSMKDLF